MAVRMDTRSVASQAVTALLTEALAPLGTRPVIRQSRWGRTRRWRVFWTRDDRPEHHHRWVLPAFWSLTLQGLHLTWETVSAQGRHRARFVWNVNRMTWDLVEGAESLDAWIDQAQLGWAAWLSCVPPPVPSDCVPPWSRWTQVLWAGLAIAGTGLLTIGLWQHAPLTTSYGGIFGALALGGIIERVSAHRWLPSVWVPDSVPMGAVIPRNIPLSAMTAQWALSDPETPRAQLWDELQDILQREFHVEDLQLHHHDSGFSLVWHTNLLPHHDELIPRMTFHWTNPYTVMLSYDRPGAKYDALYDTWTFHFVDYHYHVLHWSGTDWLTKNGEPWHLAVWPVMVAHLTTWPWIHDPMPAERQQYRQRRRNDWISRFAVMSGCSTVGALVGGPIVVHLMKGIGVHPLAIHSLDGAIGGMILALWLKLMSFSLSHPS